MLNYNNKTFRSIQNSATGEVSSATVFRYRQEGDVVTAEYEGGEIVFGTLIATVDKHGVLDMRYQHLNKAAELMTGQCISTPELLDDGRIRLHEKWQWTCGDGAKGESVVEEVKN
jgi:hypothetical protein